MLITRGRSSVVGLRSDVKKLNGQVYTPLPLAERMLSLVRWPADRNGGRLLDPACGDGVFLEAAVKKVLRLDLSRQSKSEIIANRIHGWDLDAKAVAACRDRLSGLLESNLPGSSCLPKLRVQSALMPEDEEVFSCVVGNPPYLEAKRMPDELKDVIRETCPLGGRGAFDLYTAFLDRALRMTRPEAGEICFLVPNRFLVVAYADALRRELLTSHDVGVIDLSTQKVFDDAAVYPIVVHASVAASRPKYRVIAEGRNRSLVSMSSRGLIDRLGGVMPLAPTSQAGRRLLARTLQSKTLGAIKDHAKVRWTISFHRAGLRDRYVFQSRPSNRRHAFPFLGGGRFSGNREVEPYRIDWAGSWMDYDEDRARSEGNPLPPLKLFSSPKVVLCQNSRRARAAVDRRGYLLKDTFLAVVPVKKRSALLEWICLVLNSDVFHYLYEHIYGGTRKGGSYLHFLPRYLLPFPIPEPGDPKVVKRLESSLSRGNGCSREAERLVRLAYGVDRAEADCLDSFDFPEH